MSLRSRGLVVAICVLCVLSSFSAIASTIAGFMNLGMFENTDIKASPGIWCGLLLFLTIIVGLMTVATRSMYLAGMYLVVHLATLGVSVLGIIVCIDYFNAFDEYQKKVNDPAIPCQSLTLMNCLCAESATVATTVKFEFEKFKIFDCIKFSFGRDLWLVILFLVVTCALWSLIGSIVAIACYVSYLFGKKKVEVGQEANAGFYNTAYAHSVKLGDRGNYEINS